MKQLLKTSIAPMTALCALAFVTMATPASAGEYCRKDVTSAVVSCGFDTLAQCQDMSAGRGGDCYRDDGGGFGYREYRDLETFGGVASGGGEDGGNFV